MTSAVELKEEREGERTDWSDAGPGEGSKTQIKDLYTRACAHS